MTKRQLSRKRVQVVNLASGMKAELEPLTASDHANWKFVLIRTIDMFYFVVGPVAQFRYHANLVDRFCRQYQIPSSWIKRPDLVEVLDPAAEVIGGGHLKLDLPALSVRFHGQSNAYGPFDRAIVAEIAKDSRFFAGLAVTVDKR